MSARKNVNGDIDHWSDYLQATSFQVNQQPYAGLQTSPFELLFNFVPRRAMEFSPLPDEVGDVPRELRRCKREPRLHSQHEAFLRCKISTMLHTGSGTGYGTRTAFLPRNLACFSMDT
ncbi:hypothetical protein ISCGN_031784 [Ixodes scapularis]